MEPGNCSGSKQLAKQVQDQVGIPQTSKKNPSVMACASVGRQRQEVSGESWPASLSWLHEPQTL